VEPWTILLDGRSWTIAWLASRDGRSGGRWTAPRAEPARFRTS